MTTSEPLIPKHGGYRELKSFQVAQLVYDVTVRFCDRYIDRAAAPTIRWCRRRGRACRISPKAARHRGPRKRSELKLTNVARASLEELRLDYEDFLRQRGLDLGARDPRRKRWSTAVRHCRRSGCLGAGRARPWTSSGRSEDPPWASPAVPHQPGQLPATTRASLATPH